MIKAILERQGFSVFIPLKKDEFDLLAIKQDFRSNRCDLFFNDKHYKEKIK